MVISKVLSGTKAFLAMCFFVFMSVSLIAQTRSISINKKVSCLFMGAMTMTTGLISDRVDSVIYHSDRKTLKGNDSIAPEKVTTLVR